MRFFKKNSVFFYIFVLLLISAAVYRNWLSINIFTNGDWPFAFASTIKETLHFFSWSFINGLGSVNFVLWRFPFDYAYGIIGLLGYGTSVSDKILVFWPTLIVSNLATFFLIRKITKSNLSAFVGAIVFNYNTYYFVAATAFLLYSAAAWSVLTLFIFINSLEKRKLYLFLSSGLTLVITGSYDFRVAYITVFLLIFYFLYFSFIFEKFNRKTFLVNFFNFFLVGLVFLLLNLYWILSFYASRSLTTNAILDRGLFGNEFLNILYSVSFFHPFWAGNTIAVFNPQTVFPYFWLIPIFAFLGLYLNRKNKYVLFFGLISILGIFLTKQVGHPFSNVYPFLFQHLPGFNAFREASKFYYLIALGYSVLIGGFIAWIWGFWNKDIIKVYGKYLITVLIIFIFLFTAKSIFTGEMGGIFIPHEVPQDYKLFEAFILKNNNYSKTLWIPRFSRWGMVNSTHPEVSEVDEVYSDWNKFIKSEQNPDVLFQGELFISLLNKTYSNNLLDITSIRYVVVPLEDKTSQDDFFVYYGKSRKYYIDQLDKISYLHKLNIGTKDLVVYENYGNKPHIYITKAKETVKKSIPYESINYQFINGSEYKVELKNIKDSVYLNFSESYHPQWKIRIGLFNWFNVIKDKNYFIPDKYHFENDATLNSFYVDPKIICSQYSCIKNADETYNINLTLYFVPQSYMNFGLAIGGITLVIIFGYFVAITFKNIYGKRY